MNYKNRNVMLEIWRTAIVDGEPYERFQVSNLGRLINLNYRGTGKAKLAEISDNGNGYLQVNLSKNKETKNCLVHRLVAEVFLPNPENLPQVNHKIEGDEGKKINMVFFNEDGSVDEKKSTIEWATYEENNNYGTRNERAGKTISKLQINGKCSKKVLQFTLDGIFIREWPSTAECGRNGFNQGHVAACCRGEEKSHKGFKWCYA